jgi:hypothetical protein
MTRVICFLTRDNKLVHGSRLWTSFGQHYSSYNDHCDANYRESEEDS